MSTFVLVQPAWMGRWCWNKVASQLRELGHQVYAPTLTGLAERAHLAGPDVGLSTHIDDVVAVVEFEDLRDVVLVGTSSGGTVITGAADRISDRVASLVYLDAFVPVDGQSTLDLIGPERREAMEQLVQREGSGWLLPRFAPPPWPVIVRDMWQVTDDADVDWMLSRLRPTPFRHFTDAVQLTTGGTSSIERVYVRCPRTRMPGPSPFDPPSALARSARGWKYIEIDAPHVPYITHPHEVVATLADIAAAL